MCCGDLLFGSRGTNFVVGDYPGDIGAYIVDDFTPQNTFTRQSRISTDIPAYNWGRLISPMGQLLSLYPQLHLDSPSTGPLLPDIATSRVIIHLAFSVTTTGSGVCGAKGIGIIR